MRYFVREKTSDEAGGGSSQTVATPTSALMKNLGRARIKRIGIAQFGCSGVSLI